MKLTPLTSRCGRASRRSGSALLVVLALIACMVILAGANSDTLASLKRELQLIDRQQQKHYGQGPGH